MTAGNGQVTPTPFVSPKNTGGTPSSYGLDEGTPGDLAMGLVGADAGSPAGSTSMGPEGYGFSPNIGNASMQDMSGPGSETMTFDTVNADATANNSMQDMSGPSLGAQTQVMNTDSAGRWSQSRGGNDDRNFNDMASME